MEAKRPWTIREVTYLQANAHHTIGELCAALGRSYRSVSMARHRLVPKKDRPKARGRHCPVSKTEKAKVLQLHRQGHTAYSIAKHTGRAYPTICQILKTA